jgi:hypothetical protein
VRACAQPDGHPCCLDQRRFAGRSVCRTLGHTHPSPPASSPFSIAAASSPACVLAIPYRTAPPPLPAPTAPTCAHPTRRARANAGGAQALVCKLDARAVHLPPRACGEARPFFVGPNGASIFDTLDAVSDKRSSARPVGAAERIQRVRPHCVQSRLTPRWTGVSARTHRTGRGRRRCRWWRDGVFRTGVHGNHGLYRGLRA